MRLGLQGEFDTLKKFRFFLITFVVLLLVSFMSITVLAGGSPTTGVIVYQNNGSSEADDITGQFVCKPLDAMDLSDVSGLQSKINKVNSKLKVSDFNFKSGYDLELLGDGGTKPWKVCLTDYKVPSGYVGIVLHKNGSDYDVDVFQGNDSYGYIEDITSASPFYVYSAKVTNTSQINDLAPFYVALTSVLLISFGAFFALRAKGTNK